VVIDERVFEHASENITARDVVADLELGRVEVPLDLAGKSLGVDTTWYSQLLAVLTMGARSSWTYGECRWIVTVLGYPSEDVGYH
jgi:hypothetical protein